MRPKSLLLLVLALGCGLVASIGISQVLERNANQASDVETSPIYVAVHNINLGDPIDAKMVSLQEWPKDRIPPGAVSQLDDLKGRRPRTAIIQGEPILDAKLLKPGQLADPITSIPKGFRLKTISVDAKSSVSPLPIDFPDFPIDKLKELITDAVPAVSAAKITSGPALKIFTAAAVKPGNNFSAFTEKSAASLALPVLITQCSFLSAFSKVITKP